MIPRISRGFKFCVQDVPSATVWHLLLLGSSLHPLWVLVAFSGSLIPNLLSFFSLSPKPTFILAEIHCNLLPTAPGSVLSSHCILSTVRLASSTYARFCPVFIVRHFTLSLTCFLYHNLSLSYCKKDLPSSLPSSTLGLSFLKNFFPWQAASSSHDGISFSLNCLFYSLK